MNTGHERGFTLLEVIIAMVVVGAVVLMIFVSHSTVVQVWKKNHAEAAVFRLEVVGDRLLREDWKHMVPYAFSTQRGTYPLLHGSPTRLGYVTTHGLGARRESGGGLFFTLLLLEPEGEGMGLYCYKTDIPEHRLTELFRLYAAGAQDPAVRSIEAEILDEAILLKEFDAAAFSFDVKEGSAAHYNASEEASEPMLLPLERWQGKEPPRRVRVDMRRGRVFAWVEETLPRENFQPRVAEVAVPERVKEQDDAAGQ
jgi:prepilin-type N-terminal cleavage/methylation domain-containing protein